MDVYYCDCYLCGDRFAVFAVLVKVFGAGWFSAGGFGVGLIFVWFCLLWGGCCLTLFTGVVNYSQWRGFVLWLVLLCVFIRCDYCGYLIGCVCGYCLAWFVGLLYVLLRV